MTSSYSLPRPRRSFGELVTGMRVAPVATRWRVLAALQDVSPPVGAPAAKRIYQLDYLAQECLARFVAGFAAAQPARLRLLGKLAYGENRLGLTVLSELISVYLAQGEDGQYQLVLLLPAGSVPVVLPVPNQLCLLLLLLLRKQIIH